MGGFPSGQRGQTVNLLQLASVVRIHLRPGFPKGKTAGMENQVPVPANKKLIYDRRAQIAQLVEQRTENPRVAGSIPALGMEISYFICGCSSMVEHQPSKLDTWVRFPSPALLFLLFSAGVLCSRRFRLFCDLITDRKQKTR